MLSEQFVDTIEEFGPGFYAQREAADYYNAFAAMPSLHFTWTALLGLMYFRWGPGWLKVAGVLYPLLTLLAITITGNHYLLDAVVGAAIMVVSLGVVRGLYSLHWRTPRKPDPSAHAASTGVGARRGSEPPASPVTFGTWRGAVHSRPSARSRRRAQMRVLITLDGSSEAESVLEALAPWLRRSSADVRLLTVMDASEVHETTSGGQSRFELAPQASLSGTPLDIQEPYRHAAETHGQALARAHDERERFLRDLAKRWLEGLSPRVDVVSSEHAAEAIASYAEQIEADIVAVGTHGRTGLRRALMGSVAEELVRTSPVPVLTVRAGMRTLADGNTPEVEARSTSESVPRS